MNRLPFVDWMKAIGMLLIVYGHSSSGTNFFTTDPIYVKQLGVALFMFATGYTLAREQRSSGYVVFSRLFKICLYGFAFALFLSVVGLIVHGDPAESNYLPFILGANVFVNSFPANPTTWYIGTYLHVMLFWAIVLCGVRIRWWMLAAWLPASVLVRVILAVSLGPYVAYMLLSNWLAVLLLGMLFGYPAQEPSAAERPRWRKLVPMLGLGFLLLILWPACVGVMPFADGFPFRPLQLGNAAASWVATSALVDFMYLAGAIFVYRLVDLLPRLRAIEFFSRNTLVIFICHMPLIYALQPYMGFLPNKYLKVAAYIAICYVLLACVGELVNTLVRKSGIQPACLDRLRALKSLAARRSSGQSAQSP